MCLLECGAVFAIDHVVGPDLVESPVVHVHCGHPAFAFLYSTNTPGRIAPFARVITSLGNHGAGTDKGVAEGQRGSSRSKPFVQIWTPLARSEAMTSRVTPSSPASLTLESRI